ncbi:MAG: hypothetical protein AAF581_21720 [Planctomycetota bacterium]
MTRATAILVCTAVLSCGTGCLHLDVPRDFLVVSSWTDAFEVPPAAHIAAVAADEAQLRVSSFRDDWDGNLDYWYQALEHDLVDRRGYTLLQRADRQDAKGLSGREMVFSVTHAGISKKYLVCVFDAGQRIRVVELTAAAEVFDRHLEAVQAAIATLR